MPSVFIYISASCIKVLLYVSAGYIIYGIGVTLLRYLSIKSDGNINMSGVLFDANASRSSLSYVRGSFCEYETLRSLLFVPKLSKIAEILFFGNVPHIKTLPEIFSAPFLLLLPGNLIIPAKDITAIIKNTIKTTIRII